MNFHEIKTMSDFDSSIKDNELVIFVAFAKWSGPCHIMAPLLETFSEEYKEVHFTKVDIDIVPALARRLDTHTLPTIIAYKKGEKVNELMGVQPQRLTTMIREVLGRPKTPV